MRCPEVLHGRHAAFPTLAADQACPLAPPLDTFQEGSRGTDKEARPDAGCHARPHRRALAATAGTVQAQVGAPQIVEGDSGFGVYCVQVAVNWLYDDQTPPYQTICEDGSVGPQTLKYVIWYQKALNLSPDGQVGPDTGSSMWSDISSIVFGGGNYITPWGVPLRNCYQVPPTHDRPRSGAASPAAAPDAALPGSIRLNAPNTAEWRHQPKKVTALGPARTSPSVGSTVSSACHRARSAGWSRRGLVGEGADTSATPATVFWPEDLKGQQRSCSPAISLRAKRLQPTYNTRPEQRRGRGPWSTRSSMGMSGFPSGCPAVGLVDDEHAGCGHVGHSKAGGAERDRQKCWDLCDRRDVPAQVANPVVLGKLPGRHPVRRPFQPTPRPGCVGLVFWPSRRRRVPRTRGKPPGASACPATMSPSSGETLHNQPAHVISERALPVPGLMTRSLRAPVDGQFRSRYDQGRGWGAPWGM